MKIIEHNHEHKTNYHTKLSKITGEPVLDVSKYKTMEKYITSYIQQPDLEKEKFTMINLNAVVQKYVEWKKELPRITPHYAVKCNPDPKILQVLSSLGCHFDCASQGEMDIVLHHLGEYNVSPKSIVYSNPVKKKEMIQYALDHRIRLTVFDSKEELLKLSKMPNAHKIQLLLRIKIENEESICHLSNKFGCERKKVAPLLELALLFNMNVVGVCFHVGSGCKNVDSYREAFRDTYRVFKIARQLKMPPLHLVDIGGGFNGENAVYDDVEMPSFRDIAQVLRESIETLERKIAQWDDPPTIKFISEPGRFFVSDAVSVVTNIFFRKIDKEEGVQTLFIDDGIYGSFNNMMYDHSQPVPKRIRDPTQPDNSRSSKKKETPIKKGSSHKKEKTLPTIVFGQYCDGLDQISDTELPKCKVNDWLLWENMGAYSHTTSYHFNGFTHTPRKKYISL